MSRDFTPRDHWITSQKFPDLYFSNIKITVGSKEIYMYTEEELMLRRTYRGIAICGADIFSVLWEKLNEKEFAVLNRIIESIATADLKGESADSFPAEITNWYFNRQGHYYHEPNDEIFVDYILNTWTKEFRSNDD